MVLSPELYPCKIGGVEIFNHYLVKGLSRKGHGVWVMTKCPRKSENDGIHVVELNRGYLHPPGPAIDLLIINELRKMKNNIDIVYVPYTSNSHLAYPMILAKRVLNVPYIISIHGGGMYPWRPKTPHRLFFRYADAIVAVSKTLKDHYEKRSSRSISVIPPLIPFRESDIPKHEIRRKYGFGDQDTIIISVGSIKKIKGNDILLEAFIGLGREYIERHGLKLVFVGDGPLRSELEQRCHDIDVKRYVRFLGAVGHEKINEMYNMAEIYVIPSLFEGTPITLLEAFFNGLPVIGSNTTGINNLIDHGENGLLFEKENVRDLGSKIRQMVENKDLSERLGRNGKIFYSKEYDFEWMIDEYLDIMRKICGDANE